MVKQMLIGIAAAAATFAVLMALPEPTDDIDIKKTKKKVAAGDAKAQYELSLCYYRGIYVEKSEIMAMHYLTLSAEQNYNQAQYDLSRYIGNQKNADGNISEEFIMEAMKWLKKAARNGCKQAELALIMMEDKHRENFEYTEGDFKRN